MKATGRYEDNLRFIDPNDVEDQPVRNFYVILENGEVAESDDPAWLLDAVFGYGFADCRVAETQMLMTVERLKNASLSLAMEGIYAPLYDANYLNNPTETIDLLLMIENANTSGKQR